MSNTAMHLHGMHSSKPIFNNITLECSRTTGGRLPRRIVGKKK